MAQLTTGVRAILSSPSVYNLLQTLLGARRTRTEFVERHIRPFAGMRILDFGCGPAEILEYLPKDVSYVGYDISPEYIEQARARYGDRGDFHCGALDRDRAAEAGPFDLVLASGVLHHLGDSEVVEFLTTGKAAMKPDARLVTLDNCYIDNQNPIARFIISKDRGQDVRYPEAYAALARQVFPSVEGTLTHKAWIPYTYWIMEMRTAEAGGPR